MQIKKKSQALAQLKKPVLMSQAGRIHKKVYQVNPLPKSKRIKIYKSSNLSHYSNYSCYCSEQIEHQKKHESFETVSRAARDSYLLRVTNQPNTEVDYDVSGGLEVIMRRSRRSTIDQAECKRVIGPVLGGDFSVELIKNNRRCLGSLAPLVSPSKALSSKKSLRTSQTQQHLNPQSCEKCQTTAIQTPKYPNPNTHKTPCHCPCPFSVPFPSPIVTTANTHSFASDSAHKYLQSVVKKDTTPPFYNILQSRQDLIKPSMSQPRAYVKFNLFCDRLRTRGDRAQPNWMQLLDYTPNLLENGRKGKMGSKNKKCSEEKVNEEIKTELSSSIYK